MKNKQKSDLDIALLSGELMLLEYDLRRRIKDLEVVVDEIKTTHKRCLSIYEKLKQDIHGVKSPNRS